MLNKFALVFAILLSVCVFSVESQPRLNSWERVTQYFVPGNIIGTIADTATQIALQFNDPNAAAAFCQQLAGLLNANTTAKNTTFLQAYNPKAAAITQNNNWADLADKSGRVVDVFQSTDPITSAIAIRNREINRAFMFTKLVSTTLDEMNLNLLVNDLVSVVQFKAFAFGIDANLSQSAPNITCNDIYGSVFAVMFATPSPPINSILLALQAETSIISALVPQFSANAFLGLYARSAALLQQPNPWQAIVDDLVAEGRTHLIDAVNRRFSTWQDLVTAFGDDVNISVVQPSTRRNIIKRLFDLLDDYFDRVTEVNWVIAVTVTKSTGSYDFTVVVNYTSTNATRVGDRLVNFLRGFVNAYAHPYDITVVSSAKDTNYGTTAWKAVVRVSPAPPASGPDPRDIAGVKPVLGVDSSNTAENSADAEFHQVIDLNIPQSQFAATTAAIDTALNAQQTFLSTYQTALAAARTAYQALPNFDVAAIATEVVDYATESFNRTRLLSRAIIAGTQLVRFNNLVVGMLRQDLADQNVTHRTLEVFTGTLKRQIIQLIANLNGTSRAGCTRTIPDWRPDTFNIDDYYNLTQVNQCVNVANVLGQLNLLKRQLLTAITIKNVVASKVDALSGTVDGLITKYQNYASKLQTAFTAKKTAEELHLVLQEADYIERVAACVRAITNGTLTSLTYSFTISATNNASVTHTISGSFDSSAHPEVTSAQLSSRLNAGFQLCLATNLGSDLSYFVSKATGSVAKRSLLQTQAASSSITTDFSYDPNAQPPSGTSTISVSFFLGAALVALLALFM